MFDGRSFLSNFENTIGSLKVEEGDSKELIAEKYRITALSQSMLHNVYTEIVNHINDVRITQKLRIPAAKITEDKPKKGRKKTAEDKPKKSKNNSDVNVDSDSEIKQSESKHDDNNTEDVNDVIEDVEVKPKKGGRKKKNEEKTINSDVDENIAETKEAKPKKGGRKKKTEEKKPIGVINLDSDEDDKIAEAKDDVDEDVKEAKVKKTGGRKKKENK